MTEEDSVEPWVRKELAMIADCRVFSVHESTSVSPMTAAARECMEETGYETSELVSLGVPKP